MKMTNTQLPIEEIVQNYSTNQTSGLNDAEVVRRQEENGKNVLTEAKKPNIFQQIGRHISDIASLVLLFAVVLSIYLALTTDSGWTKPIVIGSILVLNVMIGMYQEHSAEQALSALKKLSVHEVQVLRNGQKIMLDATELVVGDVILLEPGSQVPADARLITASNLSIDEAILTGESLPVDKISEPLREEPEEIGDYQNIVFSGTAVTQGNATAVVTEIGMQTELGSIAGMLNQTKVKQTPLQNRLNRLVSSLSGVAIAGGIIIFLLGMFLHGDPLASSLMIGVSLAVAAVPETLPIIVTISLAHGVKKMAKRNAIMRRVSAVETIGNVNVIASDKTGTLTQNKMTITKLWVNEGGLTAVNEVDVLDDHQAKLLKMFGLATNAQITKDENDLALEIGDSTELAIVRLLHKFGMSRNSLENDSPRLAEDPFDSTKKTMATLQKLPNNKSLLIVKGAFDRLPINRDTAEYAEALKNHDAFGREALRVLAVGYKVFDGVPTESIENLQDEVDLLGLVGMIDPPREEVIAAISEAHGAGIKTVMITGDHLETAKAIAKKIGILNAGDSVLTGTELRKLSDEQLMDQIEGTTVFARVSPEDKIRIVTAWQEQGAVVAMTGDGVNDAPALKAANVGIAMGITGTEVSKGAADMVLMDDNFATIVAAVSEGRTVYQNILKAVEFLIGVNFAQLFLMIFSVAIGWSAPLIAEQLLLINVLADGIPGFYLSREPGEKSVMKQKPITQLTSIFANGLGTRVAIRAVTFTILTLSIYAFGRFGMSNGGAAIGMTMLFLVLALGSMIDIYAIKTRESLRVASFKSNPTLNMGMTIAVVLVLAVAILPPLQNLFELVSLPPMAWLIVVVTMFIPTIVLEINKRLQNRNRVDNEYQAITED